MVRGKMKDEIEQNDRTPKGGEGQMMTRIMRTKCRRGGKERELSLGREKMCDKANRGEDGG
jgi:hypothetical protein